MKRFFYFAAIATVAMTASCSKSEPVSNIPAEVQFPEEEVTELAPIAFGSNIKANTAATKSVGPVDEWNKNMELYVYGYTVNKDNGTINDITAPYIDNVMAYAPDGSDKGAIEVYNTTEDGRQVPFYYQESTVYRFYGYYTDGAVTAEPATADGELTVPVTIDGGQDIMLAATDSAAIDSDLAAAKESATGDTDLTADLNNIETNYKSLIYSGYTARRGIAPTLNFKHKLVRFEFNVKAGSQEVIDKNVQVVAVNLIDVPNTGVLTIAPEQKAVADNAATTNFLLQEKGEDGALRTLTPKVPGLDFGTIGASLMVFPAESYTLQFTLDQDNVEVQQPSTPYTLVPSMFQPAEGSELPSTDVFVAGYKYVVNIIVYGLEEIEISAKLEEWKDAGSYELDPDKPENF